MKPIVEVAILGTRTEHPSQLDIKTVRQFKIGDMAVIYAILAWWRDRFPRRRLTLALPNDEYKPTLELPFRHIYKDVADELIFGPRKLNFYVDGEDLWKSGHYHPNVWFSVRDYRTEIEDALQRWRPTFPDEDREKALKRFPDLGECVVVQPLIDAKAHAHRNFLPTWWRKLLDLLSERYKVIPIGLPATARRIGTPRLADKTWEKDLSIREGLALALNCKLFVGGDTGFTHWAAVCGRTAVSVRPFWAVHLHQGHIKDTRPLRSGTLVYACGKDAPSEAARRVTLTFEGKLESTSMAHGKPVPIH